VTAYRLMIRNAVVISYTRWLECVQVKEDTEPEVYIAFSPRFEQIWVESRKRMIEYMEQKGPRREGRPGDGRESPFSPMP
jgi:hypothetical protein